MKTINFFILIVFLITSCAKEESPIEKKLREGEIAAIPMGVDYRYHIFFNLFENKIVKSNDKDIWDIAFQTGENGNKIVTNTSKYMFVYSTDKTELNQVMSKNPYTQNVTYDHPSGDLNLTGIGDLEDGLVRILDLGTAAGGDKHGWYKIKVIDVNSAEYTFEFAELGSTETTITTVQKDNDYTFTYFNLRTNEVVDFAPPKDKWDLEFTRYIVHLTSPLVMDYLVTGCLTNRLGTTSALVTEIDYEDIDLAYASSHFLSADINAIGYDWKDVGLENVMGGGSANYVVYPEKSYIIRDQQGVYYKLKFLSFFSEEGEKGTPTFKYEVLM